MSAAILCRVLTGVAVAHVAAALALLIAVLGGCELRVIVGLLGALAVTAAWSLWLREEARSVERTAARPSAPPTLAAVPEPADRAA